MVSILAIVLIVAFVAWVTSQFAPLPKWVGITSLVAVLGILVFMASGLTVSG